MTNPPSETSSVLDWLDSTWEIRPLNHVTECETLGNEDRDIFVKAILDHPEPTSYFVAALRRQRTGEE